MVKTVTFGEVLMRLSPPGFRKIQQSHCLDFYFGGTEMNVAASLSAFGHNVQHVSVVSDNIVGNAALAAMLQYGIDVTHVKKVDYPLGLYFMETGSGLRASEIAYNRLEGAFAHIKPHEVQWDTILKNCGWFHWTGISPALSEGAYQTLKDGLKKAFDKGITITSDPAYRSNLWKYGRSGKDVLEELVGMSTIFIGGVNEVNEILGCDFQDDKDGFIAASKELIGNFPSITKVFDKVRTGVSASWQKLYGRAWADNMYIETQEIEITAVVDRIGTGDAFAAGLIYTLQKGMTDFEALGFANAACAIKHTIPGDVNLATVAQIEAVMKGNSGGRINR